MKPTLVALLMFSILAGCGVDGPPERPAVAAPTIKGGVAVSGDARIGVVTEL